MTGRFALIMSLLMISLTAEAGQPWYASSSGEFFRWKNGEIKWISDPSDLAATVSNADAVKMVTEAFDKWAKAGLQNSAAGGFVATVALKSSKLGSLQKAVTVDNYLTTITDNKLPPTIIFDKDGAILKDLCSQIGCDSASIMAYTMVDDTKDLDTASLSIKHGVTILNGAMINKPDIDIDRFKVSIVHEIGHLLGLDHSGLNDGYATTTDASYNHKLKDNMDAALPTMYPVNLGKEQNSLHVDDVVAISTLYPSADFSGKFCTITGKITDASDVGIQGIEVVAWPKAPADFKKESVSTMTGVHFPIPTKNGHYHLRGLVPGRTYTVSFGGLPKFAADGSGIGRFGVETEVSAPALESPPISNAPEGICLKDSAGKSTDSCQITASGGTIKEVSCDKGGQTIVMDPVKLDKLSIDAAYAKAPQPVVNDPQPSAAPAPGKSGGCSLMR